MAEILKVGAIAIRDKKMLVCAKRGLDVLISLGGKLEPGESDLACLRREVKEEAGCEVEAIKYYATFTSNAVDTGKTIEMRCYFCTLKGEPTINPNDKIYAFEWIGRDYKDRGHKIAPLMELHLVPALIRDGHL